MEPILDPKTQLLVALAAAAAAKCQNCFTTLYASADNLAVSAKEVRAAVAIANKVAAKAQDFMAAHMERVTEGAVEVAVGSGKTAAGGCGCG